MRKSRVYTVFAVAAPTCLNFAVFAAVPDATSSDNSLVLTKIDTDHDGIISSAEAKAAATAKFNMPDTDKDKTLDKDGTLTAQELSKDRGRALVAMLSYQAPAGTVADVVLATGTGR